MINLSFSITEYEWNNIINYVLADLTKEEQELARKIFSKFIDKGIKDLKKLKEIEPIEPLKNPTTHIPPKI